MKRREENRRRIFPAAAEPHTTHCHHLALPPLVAAGAGAFTLRISIFIKIRRYILASFLPVTWLRAIDIISFAIDGRNVPRPCKSFPKCVKYYRNLYPATSASKRISKCYHISCRVLIILPSRKAHFYLSPYAAAESICRAIYELLTLRERSIINSRCRRVSLRLIYTSAPLPVASRICYLVRYDHVDITTPATLTQCSCIIFRAEGLHYL